MFEKIIGVIFGALVLLILYFSFYVGRLMSMKDADAVDKVITNEKKGKDISNTVYVIILGPLLIFVLLHYILNLG